MAAVVSNARRWTIVGLLFAASLINYLDRATLALALPAISQDLALGPTLKGILLSAFFWSYAVMQVPVGWCADRFNLRWLYAGMFALWSVACGLTGVASSLSALIGLRMLLGVGESIYLAGGTKSVAAFFPPEERGLPSGLFDSGSRAGLALGAPLIAWLIVRSGWRRMFFLVGFSALLWLIPWLSVYPSEQRRDPTAGRTATDVRGRCTGIHLSRDLVGICVGFFCFGYYWYLLVTWLPDLPYLIFGTCMPLGGWIADRLIHSGWNETRTRKGIITAAFLSGLMLIPATRATDTRAALGLLCGASMVGLATGNMMAILQGCAPTDRLGVWTGWENLAGNLGGVLSPMATGFLIARTGSYLPGVAVAVIVLVAGLLSYWTLVGELIPTARRTSA
ncbi:MAG: hypothetical protein DMG26_17265 [Acidobacteria bacterium]|nr:MAG: hypothetical protein DMG26_17265 [Acidobacteriota bacterium]